MGAVWLHGAWRDRYADPPLRGGLQIEPAVPLPFVGAVGEFSVQLRAEPGGRLIIAHRSEPDRALLATRPGHSFIQAARGTEHVEESRGSFTFSDHLSSRCAEQQLASIRPEGSDLTIAGTLRCTDGGSVGYTLSLRALGAHQLGFAIRLGDPRYNRTFLSYASSPDERFYGFGEQFSHFDLKGRRLPLWVMEQGIGRGAQPITMAANLRAGAGGAWHTTYIGVPHYLSSQLRSLMTENDEYQVFDLRQDDEVQVQVFADSLSGRIFHGQTPAQLIAEYTSVSGRMRPLPDWIHRGAIVGIQGGTRRVREAVAALKAQQVPVAAVWLQDWVGQRRTTFGKQLWWNWQLDRERYPDWEALRGELRRDGIRILTYVNPFLVDIGAAGGTRRNLFREAAEGGFLVRNRAGQPYLIPNTDFSAGLVDLSNPAAVAWFKEVLKKEVLGVGASGWMADFGEALPYDAVLHSGVPASRFHNQYPEAWARLNRQVIEESGDGADLVFFMRSGYRQSPRDATLFWLGDQLVSWDAHDGMKSAVTGLLSGGLSGFSLNHSDIGGYTTVTAPLLNYHRSRELLWRWMELGAWSVVFRTHEGNQPEQNHQFDSDPETLRHFARCARLYVAWADYRRKLVQEAAETGMPVARHLFLHAPGDPRAQKLSHEELLIGSDLLFVPVLDPGVTRVQAYLPAGSWIHFWSGRRWDVGPQGLSIAIEAPLGRPALFYRADSPDARHIVERAGELGLFSP